MHSLYFDGACRKNPGHSSFGTVIYNNKKQEVDTYKKYIGIATNNQAEYKALLHGLKRCILHNIKNINVFGDSYLVLQQVTGKWKINNKELKKIHAEIIPLLSNFDTITFQHIPRKENKRADQLANEALDQHVHLSD